MKSKRPEGSVFQVMLRGELVWCASYTFRDKNQLDKNGKSKRVTIRGFSKDRDEAIRRRNRNIKKKLGKLEGEALRIARATEPGNCEVLGCYEERFKTTIYCGTHYDKARKHRLTTEQLNMLYGKFDGRCWFCQTLPGDCIDHDHSCCPGKTSCGNCVRGLLCRHCNTSMGKLGDTLDAALRLVEYMRAAHVA